MEMRKIAARAEAPVVLMAAVSVVWAVTEHDTGNRPAPRAASRSRARAVCTEAAVAWQAAVKCVAAVLAALKAAVRTEVVAVAAAATAAVRTTAKHGAVDCKA